ncbi:hypothetical protein [Actinomadura sp. K4S16]|uniref:hypothetical protein n=1 Tax=Actinomadura sp. K4S16 TaxID=1316147 RepID=UPI0011EC46FF|nr:hypothetical protein [Actinomadura sp. K4S16]
MTTDPPPSGTPEYRWWAAGAKAEAEIRTVGRSRAGLEVRGFVDGCAQHEHGMSEAEIAAFAFRVYALAGRPRREQLRLLWRLYRTAVR